MAKIRVFPEIAVETVRVPIGKPKRGKWYSVVIIVERGRWLPICMAKGRYINLPYVYEKGCEKCPHFAWEKRLIVYV